MVTLNIYGQQFSFNDGQMHNSAGNILVGDDYSRVDIAVLDDPQSQVVSEQLQIDIGYAPVKVCRRHFFQGIFWNNPVVVDHYG